MLNDIVLQFYNLFTISQSVFLAWRRAALKKVRRKWGISLNRQTCYFSIQTWEYFHGFQF